MKKLIILFLCAVSIMSCATSQYVGHRTLKEMDEISFVLSSYYPQLHYYYMEGVLRVDSIKEYVDKDGNYDYKVKYSFIRYHYPNFNDRMENLKKHFPDLYRMYINGVLEITSFYKYVDKNTGEIKHHASCRRVYDFYYHPLYGRRPGLRLRYNPRPLPPARPQPNHRP